MIFSDIGRVFRGLLKAGADTNNSNYELNDPDRDPTWKFLPLVIAVLLLGGAMGRFLEQFAWLVRESQRWEGVHKRLIIEAEEKMEKEQE